MYDLPYHKAQNEQDITEFVGKYPFAFLTGIDAQNRPVATQVPVFIDRKDGSLILQGHIMKNTDHHKAFLHNDQVLVVFTGRHSYVSATWYSNPNIASTWNFMSVHMKGTIKLLEGAALTEVLRKTSLHFENYNPDSTTIYDNLPKEYTGRLINAIVAFEIEVREMDSVFKLSQDRDYQSYLNIISKLREQGEDGKEIATEMEKRTRQVFPELK
jgi:transcriptional regulator